MYHSYCHYKWWEPYATTILHCGLLLTLGNRCDDLLGNLQSMEKKTNMDENGIVMGYVELWDDSGKVSNHCSKPTSELTLGHLWEIYGKYVGHIKLWLYNCYIIAE